MRSVKTGENEIMEILWVILNGCYQKNVKWVKIKVSFFGKYFIFTGIEMLIRDLSHFRSYIWTLCAKVGLSVRTLGSIQSEGRASTFTITFPP